METSRVYNENCWQQGFCSVCFTETYLKRDQFCDPLKPSSEHVNCQQINLTWEVMHPVILVGLLFQLCLGHSAQHLAVSVAGHSLFFWALHRLTQLLGSLASLVKYQVSTVLTGSEVWHSRAKLNFCLLFRDQEYSKQCQLQNRGAESDYQNTQDSFEQTLTTLTICLQFHTQYGQFLEFYVI